MPSCKTAAECPPPPDACQIAVCNGDGSCGTAAKVGSDGNACNDDSRNPTAGCVFLPNASTCDDSNQCTIDTCDQAQKKCVYQQITCESGSPCVTQSCSFGKCNLTAANTAPAWCDDGDACSTLDTCVGSTCGGAKQVGDLTTVLGNGAPGYVDGPEAGVHLNTPTELGLMPDGSVIIYDAGNRVLRQWVPGKGVITFAGDGTTGKQNGPALQAGLGGTSAMAVGADGAVYLSDYSGGRIRKIFQGQVTTFAGSGKSGVDVDGPGNVAILNTPAQMTMGLDGVLLVSELGSIRAIRPDGYVTKFGIVANPNPLSTSSIIPDFHWQADGSMLLCDHGSTAWRLGLDRKFVKLPTFGGCDAVTMAKDGSAFVLHNWNIDRITPDGSVVYRFVGGVQPGFVDGQYNLARMYPYPGKILGMPDGSVIVADTTNHAIRRITIQDVGCQDHNPCTADACTASAQCTHSPLVVGSACSDGSSCTQGDTCGNDGACAGTPSNCNDGNACTDDACDKWGTLGCVHNNTTSACSDGDACHQALAGSGGVCAANPNPIQLIAGELGDLSLVDGTGADARFGLGSLALLRGGGFVISDHTNSVLRTLSSAGTAATLGKKGAAFTAGSAGVGSPGPVRSVAADANGNFYFTSDNRVGRWVAGTFESLCGGTTSGPAVGKCGAAQFYAPAGIVFGADGTLYVADEMNHRIVAISTHNVASVAAGVTGSFGATDGPATTAKLYNPRWLAMAPDGTLWFSDSGSYFRTLKAGVVTTRKDLPAVMTLSGTFVLGVQHSGTVLLGADSAVKSLVGTAEVLLGEIGPGVTLSSKIVGAVTADTNDDVIAMASGAIYRVLPPMRSCNDGNPCTSDSTCDAAGACVAKSALACDDDAYLWSLDYDTTRSVTSFDHAYWRFPSDSAMPGPKFGDGDLVLSNDLSFGTMALGTSYAAPGSACTVANCGAWFSGGLTPFTIKRLEVFVPGP